MKKFALLAGLLLLAPVLLFAREYRVVTFRTENAGKVVFDHNFHLGKLGNSCTACHNGIFRIGAKSPPVTMAEMEQGKSCGACHDKTKAFGLSECLRCHHAGEVAISPPDFGVVPFSHRVHVAMYGCGDCHTALFKPGSGNPHVSMKQMEEGASCGACHDGKTAFSVKETCTRCHPTKELRLPTGASFSHKFHLEMFSCGDCHSRLFVAGANSRRYTMQEMEQGKSCGGCHDGTSAFTVKGECGKCHTAAGDMRFRTAALFSHSFHTGLYACGDCHSGIFIGGASSRRYTMEEMEKGKSCGACHEGSTAFAVSGSCEKCHRKTDDIAFRIPDAGNVSFSHGFHVTMYQCSDCHNGVFAPGSRSRRVTMQEMEQGKSCGACHNGKDAFASSSSCGKCHPVKDIPFAADGFFSHTKHLEMFSCTECHSRIYNAGPENRRWTMAEMEKGNSCGACHDGSGAFAVGGSCDRCHRSTIDVTIRVPATGVTLFSHKVHREMYGCTDCHNGIFAPGSRAKRFSMADMENGKSCGTCHEGNTAFTVRENCSRCHPVREVKFKGSGAIFSHEVHTGLYRCNECHDARFNAGGENRRWTMADMEQGKSCGGCHDDSTAFSVTGSCSKCHPSTRAVQFELPGKIGNVLFSHKVHIGRGYGCGDCHTKVVPSSSARQRVTMKEMEQGKFCGACHGFSMAFSVKDAEACNRCHVGQSP